MKITFISNFHNHHQLPVCDEFMKIADVQFSFIATESVPAERVALGYQNEFFQYPYFFEIGANMTTFAAEAVCYESDVVIFGSAPLLYLKRRLKAGKLTFRYSEHLFKNGFWNHMGDVVRAFRCITAFRFKPYYVLCASAYTASDCRRILFGRKTYKWGYFPKTIPYTDSQIAANKSGDKVRLLWVGRMISWKHPESFLRLCRYLSESHVPFSAEMIGRGELEESIAEQIRQDGLQSCVTLYHSMSPEEVRSHMEKANIFVFSSDHEEGWGAVLNEAMNSACAVLANAAAGSTRYLIRDGINGLIYPDHEEGAMLKLADRLARDKSYCDMLGREAYMTISALWNSKIAVQRLYKISCELLNGQKPSKYEDGPMSKA